MGERQPAEDVMRGLVTKADKIRMLLQAGYDRSEISKLLAMDLPPESGGVGSERHAAASMVIPSMLALASAGVR
jgi:hypothetical protein